jgi:uncharacterized damage-inducible protein DinB
MQWADELMLAAVADNSPTEIAVLQHIYLGEEVWLRRVKGERDVLISELQAPADIAALQLAWPKMHRDWNDWAASGVDVEADIPHRNIAGAQFHMPAWQIVLHLVNHGSFHRGQVAAALRAKGIAPPPTDLIVYYRSHVNR